MSNHKILVKLPGDLKNSVKCGCNKVHNLDDIPNKPQEVSKRTFICRYPECKMNNFRDKPKFVPESKDRPRDKGVETQKKRNACHNCESPNHYADNLAKPKLIIYTINEEDSERE
ncbi:hypothetical protein O181_002645 [Austropuccinia psidii MF-1]|uniref:Uncharacterized protein n=1 Tax=Austropuccinia psidii MF-1 TaxID=1389203 RepID=A0A9Q3BDE9_9BASI|nr:hypothetical protein [Austropuccinia psidii MF-1]